MCVDNQCLDHSKAIVHSTGAATVSGTSVPVIVDQGNVFNSISVINDSDQDIKVAYVTTNGYNGEFIVSRSIKGFTRTLRKGKFDLSSFKVISLGNAAAIGNIYFNLSN